MLLLLEVNQFLTLMQWLCRTSYICTKVCFFVFSDCLPHFLAFQASYGVEDPQFAITQIAQTTMRSELGDCRMPVSDCLKILYDMDISVNMLYARIVILKLLQSVQVIMQWISMFKCHSHINQNVRLAFIMVLNFVS